VKIPPVPKLPLLQAMQFNITVVTNTEGTISWGSHAPHQLNWIAGI
jgi:hypothetical protein